ncbi:uncharacterized protein EV420DRAFT_218348 [Desarmillaria tabescens]|uniref:F-box domain-containing protein n=1 Tax=Armillaria tabescens TaxID=1929756 RepID=A0AA39N7R8_ARMTA|nr:uncharacterized protein EV420DRAFT_218348 [Desarmillaria tabescens]KAK0460598.1 hypothetical protein EV420DRAFT_218348 [Desarmillaria tabescens]
MPMVYGRIMRKNSTKDQISPLPQELVDIIVNYLEGDTRTLISCSLVCRKLSSRCRALLFKRCVLYSGDECNKLLDFPESTLRHIKTLCIPLVFFYPPAVRPEVLNHPSFHQVVASLGPLDLEVDTLSWSQLNDGARKTLSAHSFRRIDIQSGRFQSVADICYLLRSSHDLETLILPNLQIEETTITHPPHEVGPSVSHLTVNSGEDRLRLSQSIVSSSCPVSVNNLRVLDVNISHAEDLGLLREVLARTEDLQVLKVSHEFLNSNPELLPAADLNLTKVKSLTVRMSDYQELECPVVYPALFRWWCEVWANARTTRIDELVIRATLDRFNNPEFDITLWSQIAGTLSKPPWKTLSTLTIVIYTSNDLYAESIFSPYIKKIKDIMADLLSGTQSVEVDVSLEYPEPDNEFEYDGDDPVEGEEPTSDDDLRIGYPF